MIPSSSLAPNTAPNQPFPPDLFGDVRYFINDDVDEGTQEEIKSLLSLGGAQQDDDTNVAGSSQEGTSSPRFQLESVTHVITWTEDFPEYQLCIEPTLSDSAPAAKRPLVVTPEWVRRSAHLKIRLKEDRFSCRRAMIFSGLCVTASKSELSKADRELISSIVSAYGGLWREDHFFDVNVFLTTSSSSTKLNKIINTPGKQTICVAPQWISDSWRLQKLLPLDSYQFYLGQTKLPPCFAGRTASGSPLTSPRRDRVATSLNADSRRATADAISKDKIDSPNHDKCVFRGKSVLLARDVCRAGEQQLRTLEHFIRASGGTIRRAPKELNGIAQAVRNSDFIVCRYREVQEFREAIRQAKQVGNLTWLICVVSNDELSDPRQEPLHFPVPRQGIPEFSNAAITISNYRGATRQYLTKMIKLMGATFSGTLTAKTSLCVAANLDSQKTDKAREWKVPVVNHKYIIDSFLAWAPVERAKLKYIDFPEGVDYNLEVGETRVTDESLGPWIDDALNHDEPDDMPTSDPISPAANYASVEPSTAEPAIPDSRSAGAAEQMSPSAALSSPRQHDGDTTMGASSVMRSSPNPSEGTADTSISSPHRGSKRGRMSILQDSVRQPSSNDTEAGAGKENGEEMSPTASKKARTSGLKATTTPLEGGKATVYEADQEKNLSQRSSASQDDALETASNVPLRVATSNYKLKKADETKLKSLGIDIVDDIESADVLVTPKVSRSPKMLYSIASGRVVIVSPDWLQACLNQRELVDIRTDSGSPAYPLMDSDGEKTYGICIDDVIQRRKTEYARGIYHNHKFWLGRGVDENGSFSTLIEAAGGEVLPVPFDEDKLLSDPDHYHLVVVEDHTIEWRDLLGSPTVGGEPLKLYKKQLITDCIFEQQPPWDRHLVDAAQVAGSRGSTPAKRGRTSKRGGGGR